MGDKYLSGIMNSLVFPDEEKAERNSWLYITKCTHTNRFDLAFKSNS